MKKDYIFGEDFILNLSYMVHAVGDEGGMVVTMLDGKVFRTSLTIMDIAVDAEPIE